MCESISVGDELIHKAVYRSINGYIQNNSGALDIVLSELSKQFGGNDYTDDLCNIERSINELNKQMEDAAMIEVKLAVPTGYYGKSGYCCYPEYKFDLPKLYG